MIPGCTSSIDVELDDHLVNLNNVDHIYVTINQNGTIGEYDDDRIEVGINGYSLSVYLDQADTLRYRNGPATMQVNWTKDDGLGNISRAATDPFIIYYDRQLLRKVLT